MSDREGRDHEHERPKAPERDHQAQQEEQMVGAVENVEETQFHEPPGRLMPPRIQPDDPRISCQLERPLDAAG